MIFDREDDVSPEVGRKFLTLLFSLDGTQPCATDPEPEQWTENYTSRPIPDSVAERLCKGCPFIEECDDYATTAGELEDTGIWGGKSAYRRKRERQSGEGTT